ncbi:MAG TPA: ribosomal-protein-alanine N-acetyltransferase [Sedimenticola sp.]|nr:ribosomal-protein-alanine N-acetyltransferase [Sedimenticola sp.]
MNAILRDPLLQARPFREEDLDRIMAIERRAYPFPWTRAIFSDCLRVGYCCWLYARADEVVAYGVLSVAAGEAHLLNLTVAPAWQGQGLGRRLLRRLLTLAAGHGADTVFLEVRASNRAAISLYRSLGFNEVGLRSGYYPVHGGREDALVLALSLAERDPAPQTA